jgi:hypothetical protein
VLVAIINGTPPPRTGGTGALNFSSYQVVDNRLFAFHYMTRTVVAFNFDCTTLTSTNWQSTRWREVQPECTVSTRTVALPSHLDGALVNATNPDADIITVLDPNALASVQDLFITNIGAYPGAIDQQPG